MNYSFKQEILTIVFLQCYSVYLKVPALLLQLKADEANW